MPLSSTLAPTPRREPLFGLGVKNAQGERDILPDPRATRTLLALMNQHAVNGGAACHWGGPSAFVEIITALHGVMFRPAEAEWYERFHFVNDAGHCENGIYALRALYGFGGLTFEDLKGFRSLGSKLTGHGEVHINPEGVLIANGPLGSGIGQAQGLCVADRLSKKNRVSICTMSDGACMEGEARECLGLPAWPLQEGTTRPFPPFDL